ncbi:hypothetical protein [Dactylosporangium sp. NPDC000521]|uniref:hypothetical protein n=1 Tax=Dactylosporangium sp. NPDC000521 TaxID=3363975 RepID=UPI0036C1DED6
MSDSPLDGGSGWPTSAYAIVPRQATPPKEERRAPQEEPQEAPQPEVAEPPQEAPGRRWRIAALVIGLIVLLAAAVGGVLATRESSGDTQTPTGENRAATAPMTEATTPAGATAGATVGATASPSLDAGGSPAASTGGTPDPSAVVTSPVPEGTVTDVLRAGTVRMTVLAGQPDETFDFDNGAKQASGADVAAGALGLTAVGGAAFAPVLAAPTLAVCSAVPAAQWSDRVLLSALLPVTKVCVRTGDQRFGWFTPRSGEAIVSGQLYTTYLDFTVWKKAGD